MSRLLNQRFAKTHWFRFANILPSTQLTNFGHFDRISRKTHCRIFISARVRRKKSKRKKKQQQRWQNSEEERKSTHLYGVLSDCHRDNERAHQHAQLVHKWGTREITHTKHMYPLQSFNVLVNGIVIVKRKTELEECINDIMATINYGNNGRIKPARRSTHSVIYCLLTLLFVTL